MQRLTIQSVGVLGVSALILLLSSCGGGAGGKAENFELTNITLSAAQLDQPFDAANHAYTATVGHLASTTTVSVTTQGNLASFTLNGETFDTDTTSNRIPLEVGTNVLSLQATSVDAETTATYTLTIVRQSLNDLVQQAYVKASNTDAFDEFGYGVAIDGDTLAISSLEEASAGTGTNTTLQNDNSAKGAGAVYVLRRLGGAWHQEAYLKASNAEAGDHFGRSIALSGNTLVVGADEEDSSQAGVNGGGQSDNSAVDSGAVYVFVRSNGVWIQQAYVKASNTGPGDRFGISVDLAGNTLVIGAPGESSISTGVDPAGQDDDSAPLSGAVYVFQRQGSLWSQSNYLKSSNSEENDQVGISVAISDDENWIASGAVGESSNGTTDQNNSLVFAGAAYVFTRDGKSWIQDAYIKPSNPDSQDVFGSDVSIDQNRLAVGARWEDSNGTGVNPNTEADNSGTDSGAVYVFSRQSGGWIQDAYIKALALDSPGFFGSQLSLSGNTLAVGAYRESTDGTGINSGGTINAGTSDSGAVFVYESVQDQWTPVAHIKASNTGMLDQLGFSMDLSGATLAVGSPGESSSGTGINGPDQDNNSASSAGAVYVFH